MLASLPLMAAEARAETEVARVGLARAREAAPAKRVLAPAVRALQL
jgi:hypothetical protein